MKPKNIAFDKLKKQYATPNTKAFKPFCKTYLSISDSYIRAIRTLHIIEKTDEGFVFNEQYKGLHNDTLTQMVCTLLAEKQREVRGGRKTPSPEVEYLQGLLMERLRGLEKWIAIYTATENEIPQEKYQEKKEEHRLATKCLSLVPQLKTRAK